MRRTFLLGLLFLIPASTLAAAELTLFAGYRFGGPTVETPPIFCFSFPCPQGSELDSQDGEAFGLVLDVPFRPKLMFEILISHQSGDFEDDEFTLLEIYPQIENARFDLTFLHLGLLRQWDLKTVSPFAAVGFGVAQLEADRPLFFFDSLDEDRLSASLAGGLKIHLNSWLGVRVEARTYWADMPDSLGEDLLQVELSSGISFKL